MNAIEGRIAETIKNGGSLYYKKGEGYTKELYHDMVCGGMAFLLGTCYAQLKEGVLKLGVYGGAWKTVTTKGRINAIASAFNLPRVYQKDYAWIWSDGVPYDGVREFKI